MRCALVDDDVYYHNRFKSILENKQFDIILNTFSDTDSFYRTNRITKYDVVFLDIEMPGTNGIELAEQLHNSRSDSLVVFITNRSDTVFQAFGLNVIGFIEKEKINIQLPSVMRKIQSELSLRRYLNIKLHNGDYVKINSAEVIYCEISIRKIYLYLSDQHKYILNYPTISEVFKMFDSNSFVFVNRSVFVNLNKISYLGHSYLRLEGVDKQIIDISKYRYNDVKKLYMRSLSL